MRAALIPLFVGYAFAQQPAASPKPFTPTAEIGKPYIVGEDPDDYGKIKLTMVTNSSSRSIPFSCANFPQQERKHHCQG